jgi:hypothetical protein
MPKVKLRSITVNRTRAAMRLSPSPPSSGKFFYVEDCSLRHFLRAAVIDEGKSSGGKQVASAEIC